MKCRDQFRAAVVEDPAPKARNRIERAQQRLGAELAQRDNDFRLDDVDLTEEKRLARFDFVRLGIPVLRRTALDDVGDVHVLALEPDCLDDLREQLSGAAHKRKSLQVFVAARRFTDEHQIGFGVAHAKHNLRSALVQLAPRAVADVGADADERIGRGQRDRQRPDLGRDRRDLGQRRVTTGKGPVLVGFAAETENVVARAKAKRERKRVDLIVANDVSAADAGFDVENNAVTIVGPDGAEPVPLQSKARIAAAILDRVERLVAAHEAARTSG